MLLVKRLVFVLEHIVEHGSILHIVPIDQEVGRRHENITGRIHKRNAGCRMLLLKITSQIEFRIILCLHDRIIDLGSVHRDPSDDIAVRLIQIHILADDRSLVGFHILPLRFQLCQILKTALFPHSCQKIIEQHARRSYKHDKTEYENDFSS